MIPIKTHVQMLFSIFILDSLSHLFLFKSPFPYTSTNPTFSRLAFEPFSLDFFASAADSHSYLNTQYAQINSQQQRKPSIYIHIVCILFGTSLSKYSSNPPNITLLQKALLQWVGKMVIPPWLVLRLLSCKKGSDSCRKWRKEGKKKSCRNFCQKQKEFHVRIQVTGLSNPRRPFLVIIGKLLKNHSPLVLTCRQSKLILIFPWRQSLQTYGPSIQLPLAVQKVLRIQRLTPLFICRSKISA